MKTTILILLLLPLVAFTQQKKYNFKFTFVFGDCFREDSVDVKIQKALVLSGKLNSNSAGKANLSFTQYPEHLKLVYNGKVKKLAPFKTKPTLKIEISLNGKWYTYDFDLKKGVIFLIENCNDPKTGVKTFTIEQGNDPLFFI